MSVRLAGGAVVAHAIDAVRRAGASGEVFLRDSRSTSVEIADGVVQSNEAETERGVGVRVLTDARVGFAYTSDLSPAGVDECVELALANARVTTPDETISFAAGPSPADGALAIHDPSYDRHDVAEKIALTQAIEAAAKRADPRIQTFYRTSYGDGEGETILATTEGAFGSFRSSSFGAGTSCIAVQAPEKQAGWFGDGGRTFDVINAERIGAEAARRAVEKLGARPFGTQRIDVVLEPYQAMLLLGAIAPLFSAENVLKGKSLFAGRLGEGVASSVVTIVDEGRRVAGRATVPFDGEGTPTRDLRLVDQGTLAAYLHSRRSANRMGVRATGNARRGSYAGTPHPGISNFTLLPGTRPVADLLRSTDRALAITSLLNLHTVDPISGEFSLGATATYLEKGVAAYPVKGVTIAGNLIGLLGSIAAVGDDLRFGAGGISSPTIVVRDVSVGGA